MIKKYLVVFMDSACYACQSLIYFNFLDIFSEKKEKSNFVQIRPVGAELFHADGQTDKLDEDNSLLHLIKTCTGDIAR